MPSSLFFNAFSVLGSLIHIAIVAVIVRRKLLGRWPSIFTYCLLSLAFDVAIIINRPIYKRYFYLYWTWAFLAAMLRLWILGDIVKSFPGVAAIGSRIRLTIGVAGTVVALGSALITVRDGATLGSSIVRVAVLADRCVSISWGAFLVVALLAICLLRVGWQRTGALIANALIVKIAAGIAVAYLVSFTSHRMFGNYLQSAVAIAVFATWLWAFCTDKEEVYLTLSQPTEHHLKAGTTCT